MTIPLTEWLKKHGIKKREAYRMIERGQIKPIKELREIVQKRKMWVLCIDDSVKFD